MTIGGGCMLVILEKERNDDISESIGVADGEQPSRKLLRSGCIQRYVRNERCGDIGTTKR